jgi:hypothetical protein
VECRYPLGKPWKLHVQNGSTKKAKSPSSESLLRRDPADFPLGMGHCLFSVNPDVLTLTYVVLFLDPILFHLCLLICQQYPVLINIIS